MSRTFLPQTSSSTSQSYKTSLTTQNSDLDPPDFTQTSPEQAINNNITLRSQSPRSNHSYTKHSSKHASPSPPPSFYRSKANAVDRDESVGSPKRYKDVEYNDFAESDGWRDTYSLSPSPTRSRKSNGEGRKIMFAAPPPPIAASILLRPSNGSSRGSSRENARTSNRVGSRAIDPLLMLERREKAIQRDLQALLDAQSEGLLAGFGAVAAVESGNNTPTTSRSMNGRSQSRGSGYQGRSGGGITPVRQPKVKPLGLRAARKGLLQGMASLAEIKSEENLVLETEIARREQILQKIGTWEQRIATATKQVATVNSNEADDNLGSLEEEQVAIDKEMEELEDRLASLKARKSHVERRITEGVNKREARLSSYRGALREAEMEVKSFLHHPPTTFTNLHSHNSDDAFINLPVSRRTLSLAHSHFSNEQSDLQHKQSSAQTERDALEQGLVLWAECMDTITAFEDDLRIQMKSGKVMGTSDLKSQVEKMGSVIEILEGIREKAEGEGWNLLLVAVASEEEAFRQGRSILVQALGGEGESEGESDDGGSKEKGKGKMKEKDGKVKGFEEEGGGLIEDRDRVNDVEDGVRLSRLDSAEMIRESSEDEEPNLQELLVDNRVD